MILGLLFALLAASAVIILYLGFRAYRTDPLSSLSPEDRALIKDESRLKRRADGPVKRLGARLGPSLGRLFGGKYPNWIESKILLTDKKQYHDFAGFMAFKGSIVLLCVLGGIAVAMFTKSPLFLLVFIAIGLLLPDLALIQSGRKRQEAIEDSLP